VRELSAARSLASHLTAWSEGVLARVKAGMLSTGEANSILQGEIRRLRSRFAAQSALDLADGRREEEARRDRIAAAAYSLIATRGLKFDPYDTDRERLQREGFSPQEIEEIHPLLASYVKARILPPLPGKMANLLHQRGITDTEVNRANGKTTSCEGDAPP